MPQAGSTVRAGKCALQHLDVTFSDIRNSMFAASCYCAFCCIVAGDMCAPSLC